MKRHEFLQTLGLSCLGVVVSDCMPTLEPNHLDDHAKSFLELKNRIAKEAVKTNKILSSKNLIQKSGAKSVQSYSNGGGTNAHQPTVAEMMADLNTTYSTVLGNSNTASATMFTDWLSTTEVQAISSQVLGDSSVMDALPATVLAKLQTNQPGLIPYFQTLESSITTICNNTSFSAQTIEADITSVINTHLTNFENSFSNVSSLTQNQQTFLLSYSACMRNSTSQIAGSINLSMAQMGPDSVTNGFFDSLEDFVKRIIVLAFWGLLLFFVITFLGLLIVDGEAFLSALLLAGQVSALYAVVGAVLIGAFSLASLLLGQLYCLLFHSPGC